MMIVVVFFCFFFFKQKTAYEMRISDWSSDVCSSDLIMDQQKIISQLEARAKRLGLSMSSICKDAGVHPTTFSRWKASERNPDPVGATISSMSKLESVLSRAERRPPKVAACSQQTSPLSPCPAATAADGKTPVT